MRSGERNREGNGEEQRLRNRSLMKRELERAREKE